MILNKVAELKDLINKHSTVIYQDENKRLIKFDEVNEKEILLIEKSFKFTYEKIDLKIFMSFDKEEEFFNYIGIVLNNEKRTIITKPEFLKIFTKFFENRENKNEWVLNYKSFTFIGWKNSFKIIIFHNPITKE